MRDSRGFTEHDRETAIRVMAKSRIARNWAEGQAKAYDVDLHTPEGKKFFEKACREMAERLVR